MEVCHQHIDYPEAEAGNDNDPGIQPQFIKAAGIKVADDGIKGFIGGIRILPCIRTPLLHWSGLTGLDTAYSNVVKGLQSTHGSGSNGYNFFVTIFNIFVSLADTLNERFLNNQRLAMHGMIGHIGAFYGQEGTGTHVETDGFCHYTLLTDTAEDGIGEMKTGGRSGDGATETGVEGLVSLQVYGLCLAVEIRWNGHCTACLEDCGKGRAVSAGDLDDTGLTLLGEQARPQVHPDEGGIGPMAEKAEHVTLPALGIADDTAPHTAGSSREDSAVLGRLNRLEAEHLDMCTGLTLEMKAGGNNLGIIEDHEGTFGQKVGNVTKDEFIDTAVTITQKLRRITFRERILGYLSIRKRIVIIFYMDFGYHRENLEFLQSYTI